VLGAWEEPGTNGRKELGVSFEIIAKKGLVCLIKLE
jgi:hypothetical protein